MRNSAPRTDGNLSCGWTFKGGAERRRPFVLALHAGRQAKLPAARSVFVMLRPDCFGTFVSSALAGRLHERCAVVADVQLDLAAREVPEDSVELLRLSAA